PFGVTPEQRDRLGRLERRDLLLLTAVFDHSLSMNMQQRWNALRRKLKFPTLLAETDRAVAIAAMLAFVALSLSFPFENWKTRFGVFQEWWFWLIMVLAWSPWVWRQLRLFWTAWRVSRQIRVIDHLPNMLRRVLARFQRSQLAGQPIPSRDRSDD